MRKALLIFTISSIAVIFIVSVLIVRAHAGYYAPYDPRDLQEGLSRIEAWMQTNAPELEAGLRPGLALGDITVLARKHGVKLSQDVENLYEWANGSGPGQVFFGEYQFLPLAEALAYGEEMRKARPDEPWELPLFRSTVSSAVYAADLTANSADGETSVRFIRDEAVYTVDSVPQFITVLANSFQNGAFTYTAQKTFETKEAIFEQALLEYRGERRQRAMQFVLNGLPDHIAPDEEMQAYEDLLATGNPHAESLILQAAERWAFDEDYSYTTMLLVSRLDTQGGFDLLQKHARHINRVVRLRAYNMLSFVWPSDGRTLDAPTEQKALDDLANQTYDNSDRRLLILAMRRARDLRPVPMIIDALANPEKDTRLAAVQTLVTLKDPRGLAAIRARIPSESEAEVREACERAVGAPVSTLAQHAKLTRLASY
jgi:cell wall assembly regulator SMI1